MYSNLELLKHHSGVELLTGDVIPSLVSTLRPFSGCEEESFADFMRLATCEHNNLAQESKVGRELVLSFFSTCQSFHLLVLSEKGPIKRNKLADAHQLSKMEMWHDAIESFAVHSLSRHENYVCLQRLMHYLCYSDIKNPGLYSFLLPFVRRAADDHDFGMVDDAKDVLRKLESLP